MVPEDRQYSTEHAWVRVDDDVATVGITEYAQDQLGDVIYIQLPEVRDLVVASTVVGELESTRAVSDIFSPVTGKVVGRNDVLDNSPETINSDPYGDGWLFKVEIGGVAAATELLSAAEYATVAAT